MNKSEKLICLLLGVVFAWYVFVQMPKSRKAEAAASTPAVPSQSQAVDVNRGQTAAKPSLPVETKPVEKPSVPEQLETLENGQLKVVFSSWGGVVKAVTLKEYPRDCGKVSEDNPAVVLDFSEAPLGAIGGLPGVGAVTPYAVVERTDGSITFANDAVVRQYSLGADYQIVLSETFRKGSDENAITTLSLGSMRMGDSKNDLLSVDSWAMDAGKGKEGVIHHGDDDSPLKRYLAGGLSGGCSGCGGSGSAAALPAESTADCPGAQKWIALKNRFFVTALVSVDQPNLGFSVDVKRDLHSTAYRPESVAARVRFGGVGERRKSVFYVGPKKQSMLWDLGMRDVMEFGMWRWLCYPLVLVLNLFFGWIPNYGVAIVLLTLLVRFVFWPLTHKSTIGMKKLQEVQPLMKELQAKYKDNPQRLQQETLALYREKKVNPMSSCLPMLIQIPVFIALFNVLRAAVELRYAPFLWIADLSEPEGLGATSWFPFFGGLNVLPVLMAVTMALQSALTPSSGDRQQQKMMIVFMPVMMLFMFYNFPSALSLYWTLSQVISIIQMWMIRRSVGAKAAVSPTEVIDPPVTRQMKRHQA